MNTFLDVFAFSASITLPIFLILALGVLLSRLKMINDNFVDVASKLVFNVTLPSLLFISITKAQLSASTGFSLVAFGVLATLAVFLFLEWSAGHLIPEKSDRGVVVQGAFRSNMGIIGLAYCVNAYGNGIYSVASVYLGGVTMLFNILSVVTLNRSLNKNASLMMTVKGLLKNPLIIGILSALAVSTTGFQLPGPVLRAGDYFAQMTLPLALLCAGASLSFGALRFDLNAAVLATIGKLLVVPLVLTGGGFLLGFRGEELGVLFLMSSAPSASAGYIMARAMGGNSALAANIIVLTTLTSLLTTSLGVTLLRSFQLM